MRGSASECADAAAASFGSSFSAMDKRLRFLLLLLVALVCVAIALKYSTQLPQVWTSTRPAAAVPSDLAETHYAVVVDAGSSGSRAFLYSWPEHSGNEHELLKILPVTTSEGKPLIKKVAPGLSSLKDTPQNALKYMSPLLDFALEHIPSAQVSETPLFILATAGMRLVEKPKQEAIIESLRTGINSNYSFLFQEGNLEIISGKQEGIYQWLAINYILGKFDHMDQKESMVALKGKRNSDADGDHLVLRPRTVGALDMGGASLQIAMEITSNLQMEGMTEQDRANIAEINIGCTENDHEHSYRIFVSTFLGFGANEAMARYARELFLGQIEKGEKNISGLDSRSRISDPCSSRDMTNTVNVKLNPEQMSQLDEGHLEQVRMHQRNDSLDGLDLTLHLLGAGNWKVCRDILKSFTERRETFLPDSCEDGKSCRDNTISMPDFPGLQDSEFYGFSEFWYSMEDVLRMGGPYIYSKFQNAAEEYCSTPWRHTWQRFSSGEFPLADADRMRSQCFKSAWVTVALHEGVGFPAAYAKLSAAPETVNGKVVHWTIGALLYRMRFFPLKMIGSHSRHNLEYHVAYHSALSSFGNLYSHYIVLACLLLVIAAIIMYLKRLRRYVKPSTLRKMPPKAFWLAASDDVGHGLPLAPDQNLRLLSVRVCQGDLRGGKRSSAGSTTSSKAVQYDYLL